MGIFNSLSSEPKQSRKKEEASYQLLKLWHRRPYKNSLLQVLRTFQLNIPNGPRFAVEEGVPEFELKSSLINLVQATQFNGMAHADASAHLQNFLEIGSTIHINGVDKDVILLHLFPFSLEGKARKWIYTHQDNINNWTNL